MTPLVVFDVNFRINENNSGAFGLDVFGNCVRVARQGNKFMFSNVKQLPFLLIQEEVFFLDDQSNCEFRNPYQQWFLATNYESCFI